MKQRVIVGLTGPTGSGKSLASKAAALCGFTVVDCDLLARRAVEKGTPGLRAVTEAFGSSVVSPDGSLDRKALARVAFSSSEQTERLNQTLLPHIMKLALKEAGEGDVLFDAPTLFESGLDRYCDKTVAVLAPRAVRLERIIRRSNNRRSNFASFGRQTGFLLQAKCRLHFVEQRRGRIISDPFL